ncbi:MAG: TetR/AcrR family transcriptional regulator [Acetobacteraceae bacterium]|nr:TetR/AcrR family transcriptional regulator [Acetobacteraceae bacterium]
MGRPKFSEADFLAAALAVAAAHGPAAVTVASITERLRAPTGSFYHRFSSRNVLLGALWLQTVFAFRRGIAAALDAGDGLGAALHTPAWVREHPDEARLLLVHNRDDFVQGGWPEELREQAAALADRSRLGTARFARRVFGAEGPEELRRSQFLLAEVPVAAVRQHILRREPPPPLVDGLIRATFRAVVADHRRAAGGARTSGTGDKSAGEGDGPQR